MEMDMFTEAREQFEMVGELAKKLAGISPDLKTALDNISDGATALMDRLEEEFESLGKRLREMEEDLEQK